VGWYPPVFHAERCEYLVPEVHVERLTGGFDETVARTLKDRVVFAPGYGGGLHASEVVRLKSVISTSPRASFVSPKLPAGT
jgi:hypothetical protein